MTEVALEKKKSATRSSSYRTTAIEWNKQMFTFMEVNNGSLVSRARETRPMYAVICFDKDHIFRMRRIHRTYGITNDCLIQYRQLPVLHWFKTGRTFKFYRCCKITDFSLISFDLLWFKLLVNFWTFMEACMYTWRWLLRHKKQRCFTFVLYCGNH